MYTWDRYRITITNKS